MEIKTNFCVKNPVFNILIFLDKLIPMNLFELIIAGFFLVIILLGIISAELQNLRLTRQLFNQTFADIQLQNLLERLRANDAFQARQRELLFWNKNNSKLLRNAHGSYRCQAHVCYVTVQWRDLASHKIHEGAIF